MIWTLWKRCDGHTDGQTDARTELLLEVYFHRKQEKFPTLQKPSVPDKKKHVKTPGTPTGQWEAYIS